MDESLITNRTRTFTKLVRVKSVVPLTDFTVHVQFTDGSERDIDLEKYLEGPVFEPIRSRPEIFRQVRVEGGTLAWPNEVDIDPDVLYYDGAPPWAQVTERALSRRQNRKSKSKPRRVPSTRPRKRVARKRRATRARKMILT